MKTQRLTMGQAVVEFLKNQYVERDGVEHQFFAGMFGIFGHGNGRWSRSSVTINTRTRFRFYQTRNEQAMVHTAAAFAKMNNRLRTFACTSSIGPGPQRIWLLRTAGATINRIPVLLLAAGVTFSQHVSSVLSYSSLNHPVRRIFR